MNKMKVEKYFRLLMEEGLGLDMSNPNLLETPSRVARMYQELFSGLDSNPLSLTSFPNESKYDEIVILDNIFFVSVCSHHFLPFTGKAWVAYIPGKKVIGASKPSRIITQCSAKPHLQEDLTMEVISILERELEANAIMVVMRAVHGCMVCRGIKQYNGSGMITSACSGEFKSNPSAKSEVMSLIQLSMKQ